MLKLALLTLLSLAGSACISEPEPTDESASEVTLTPCAQCQADRHVCIKDAWAACQGAPNPQSCRVHLIMDPGGCNDVANQCLAANHCSSTYYRHPVRGTTN